MSDLLQTPRGTKDILPEDQIYWFWVTESFMKIALGLGFERIETPTFEYESVFTKGIGQTSDIVLKEMFEVRRLGNDQEESDDKKRLVLRPEGTAAVVRAYIEHGMQTWTQPVRLFYIESMFRYDRPQKGRYREHHQLGLEYFGDADPVADATILLAYWQLLVALGLNKNITFNINSLGDDACRPQYKKELKTYFEPYRGQLCPDCQRRLDANPLRILDCKEEKCQTIATSAPVLLDRLCEACKLHFGAVLDYLDELEIPYDLTPHLVRGLDYYNRTVFEVVELDSQNRQSSISGGGRYDSLVKLYGGRDTPAVGTGIGVERVVEKLKERGLKPPAIQPIVITVISLGEKSKKTALRVVQQLLTAGYGATGAFTKESLKAQLKYADKVGSPLAVIVGTREVYDKTVIIRDMKSGIQDTVSLELLEEAVKTRLDVLR